MKDYPALTAAIAMARFTHAQSRQDYDAMREEAVNAANALQYVLDPFRVALDKEVRALEVLLAKEENKP